MADSIEITSVSGKADRTAFVELAFRLYADDPYWIAPLKDEVRGLITPGKNPWFEHATAEFFLARRGGKVVGRISAQVDRLVQAMPEAQGGGAGVGHWGLFEAEDAAVAAALIVRAEDWLRAQGSTRAMAPFSLSVWDEPALLVDGFADHPPTVMMGHHRPEYARLGRGGGLSRASRTFYTYELDITQSFPRDRSSGSISLGRAQPADHACGKVDRRAGSTGGGGADPRHPQRCLVATIGGSCRSPTPRSPMPARS